MFDRPPPHSLEAEMALLGAMILDPKVIYEVIQVLKEAGEFYLEAHSAIFGALVHTYDLKQAGDLVLLKQELEDKGKLADVGGVAYLQKLAQETPGPATAVHYARIVSSKAKLRRLIDAGGKIVFDAYHGGHLGPDASREIIDSAEARIFEIAHDEESGEAEPLGVLVEQEFKRLEALQGKGCSGVRTYFEDLDELTSGLQPGEMIVIAARPSMGKTALALNLAEQVALGHAPYGSAPAGRKAVSVGFFSLEMSKSAIAQRLLSAKSGFSSHDLRSGRLSTADYDELSKACVELEQAPIYVDDTPGLTILGLRTRARRLVAQHGVQALFIDYMQLMSAPQAARESRQVEVSAISRGVKALARELNIPVVVLSQLNRGPESRGDNRPRMSDLRESGAIEQDADVIILLHREAYYHAGDPAWDPKHAEFDPENEAKLTMAELIIAKQRNGPTDTVRLTWDAALTRFKSFAGYAGGTGLSGGYAAPGPARRGGGGSGGFTPGGGGGSAPPFAPNDPFKVQVHPFSPGRKTGPVGDFRDGGGPEKDGGGEDIGDLPV